MEEDQIKDLVESTIREHQLALLQTAATNAKTIAKAEVQSSSILLKDSIDTEIERSQAYGDVKWKSDINKNSFDFCRQVHELWEKTSRAVSEKQYDKVDSLAQKGKQICKNRLKAVRLADKDGWDVALNYLSDDLADDENDRKRMRKAKKTAESAKNKKSGFSSRGRPQNGYNRGAAFQAAQRAGPSGYRGRQPTRRSDSSDITC